MEKMRDLAAGTFGPESEQATQRDAALRDLAFQEKALTLRRQEQEAEIALNKDAATRAGLLFDQLQHQEKINQKLAEMKELSAQTYGEESPQFAKASKDLQEGKNAERRLMLQVGFADAEKRHNENLQQRNVTLKSQSDILDSQIYMEKSKLATLEAQAQVRDEYAIAAQKAAVAAAELEKQNFDYQHGKEIEQQKLTTEAQRQQSLGNQKLAQLAQNRAQFEEHIADAIRNQNGELAKQLINQKALADLEAKAANLLKTPDQKAKDFQEQLDKKRALKLAAARDFQKLSPEEQQKERDRKAEELRRKGLPPGFFKSPAPGFKKPSPKEKFPDKGPHSFKSSEDHTSPATEDAIKGFIDRNAPNIKKGAEGFLERANNFTAKEIKTETITANKIVIKTAP
jgi:hypothetical protein